MFRDCWWCTWHILEYLTLNKNNQATQTHCLTLQLLLWVYCFCTAVLHFSMCKKQLSLVLFLSLYIKIYSFACYRLLSVLLFKLKRIVFSTVSITCLLSSVYTPTIIMTWLNCCNVFWWYKRYTICLSLCFSLFELFPVFICANNIGSLINSLL